MKRHGFTLIELLVVIAIIAILAAILFPVFMSAKDASRRTKCMSNMRQISFAMFSYADDHQGFLPALNAFSLDVNSTSGNIGSGTLFKYMGKSKGILWCPSDVKRRGTFRYSYTMNGWCTWATHSDMLPPPTSQDAARAKANTDGFPMGWFSQPRRTILLVDENTDPNVGTIQINDQLFVWYDITGDKHSGKANVSYLDGHKGQVKAGLIWNDAKYPDGTSVFHQPN